MFHDDFLNHNRSISAQEHLYAVFTNKYKNYKEIFDGQDDYGFSSSFFKNTEQLMLKLQIKH